MKRQLDFSLHIVSHLCIIWMSLGGFTLSSLSIAEWAVMSEQTGFYSYTNRTVIHIKTKTKFNMNAQTDQHRQTTQTVSLSCKSAPPKNMVLISLRAMNPGHPLALPKRHNPAQ